MDAAYKFFGTNKELESGKGVKLQYPGFSITIHRAGGSNKKYAATLAQKMKPHRQRFERGLLDDETSERLLMEVYAESVVVGWENIAMDFTPENCVKLFVDLPDLYADIKTQAMSAATFRDQMEGIEEKN